LPEELMPTACPVCAASLSNDESSVVCPKCGWNQAGGETAAHLTGGETDDVSPETEEEEKVPEALARRLPDYRDWAHIGRGATGDVWAAWHPVLDREVAVKVLRPAIAGVPGFADRFEREARALAKLDRPDIVRVHDFGKADDLYFLVMEYIPENLREYRVNLPGGAGPAPFRKFRTLNKLLDFFIPICRAAAAAHDVGYVHRDIKPENILVAEGGVIKLADFGLARLVDPEDGDQSTAGVAGTPNYMAPEQRSNPAAVDRRADVYALGVILYELLFGVRPVGRFPMLSEAGLDPRLDAVFSSALASDPKHRYRSATELANALAAIRSHSRPIMIVESAVKLGATVVVGVIFLYAALRGDNNASYACLFVGWLIPNFLDGFLLQAFPNREIRDWYRPWMKYCQEIVVFLFALAVNLIGPALGAPRPELGDGLSTAEWFLLVYNWLVVQWLSIAVFISFSRSGQPREPFSGGCGLGILLGSIPFLAFLTCAITPYSGWSDYSQWGPAMMTCVVFAYWAAEKWRGSR